MRSFNSCMRIARPQHMLLAALTTWVMAMLSNGPHWFTPVKVAAPIVMALCVFGASLFHFGMANPMYSRKSESLAVRNPLILMALVTIGFDGMLTAIAIAFAYLNDACKALVVIDAIIIILYPELLSRHWRTKNGVIAFVCVSPILLGWFSGHRLSPSVPYGIGMAFFSFLAREIVKDIQDRIVNHGYRWTLPLWLGIVSARYIAGACMLASMIIVGFFGATLWQYSWHAVIPYVCASGYFLATTLSLFLSCAGRREAKESRQILLGNAWMILTFFLIIGKHKPLL